MNVTFRQLKVFEAVARHLSYTRAASELYLTQPAVSMQIKQLEEVVGLPLFEQIGKRVFLTDAGSELHRYARNISQQLDEAREVLEEMKGIQRGRLNISVATTAIYFAPTLLGAFHKRYPGIGVSMDVANRETLLQQLENNEIDMAIMGQPPEELNMVADAFLYNPLVVIAPPDHPLARQKNIDPVRLADEVFVLREPGSGTRSAAEKFFSRRGVQLRTAMVMSSLEAIKQAVQASLGLAIVSTHTIKQELELGRLVVLDIKTLPIQRQWYLVHREDKRLSVVAQSFKDFMLAEASKLLS